MKLENILKSTEFLDLDKKEHFTTACYMIHFTFQIFKRYFDFQLTALNVGGLTSCTQKRRFSATNIFFRPVSFSINFNLFLMVLPELREMFILPSRGKKSVRPMDLQTGS